MKTLGPAILLLSLLVASDAAIGSLMGGPADSALAMRKPLSERVDDLLEELRAEEEEHARLMALVPSLDSSDLDRHGNLVATAFSATSTSTSQKPGIGTIGNWITRFDVQESALGQTNFNAATGVYTANRNSRNPEVTYMCNACYLCKQGHDCRIQLNRAGNVVARAENTHTSGNNRFNRFAMMCASKLEEVNFVPGLASTQFFTVSLDSNGDYRSDVWFYSQFNCFVVNVSPTIMR